jgi:hypothetical protein
MNLQETEKAYKSILKLVNKNKDSLNFDLRDLECISERHLLGIKLKEVYGLNIEPKRINSLDWLDFGEHLKIGRYGEKYNRTISWSDNGKQPEDELLIVLKFPCGAYTFDGDYPTDFFQKFFLELKSYNPKYIDTTNKSLYFSLENGKDIFNSFNDIFKKYRDLNKEDKKQREIIRMEKELERLKSK